MISGGITHFHAIICTFDNKIYSFGQNEKQQIGFKTPDSEHLTIPELIDYKFDSNIKAIACGWQFTLFLTENGNLYGCGANECKQLTKTYRYRKNTDGCSIRMIFNDGNIIKIGCCNQTSVILNDQNVLTMFGSDISLRKYGWDYYSQEYSMKTVEPLGIIDFHCGFEHFGYITKNNELYMMGGNAHCECGRDTTFLSCKEFKLNIDGINGIIGVKCGWYFTIIKSDKNEYYSFGINADKELLLDLKVDQISVPTKISIQYIQNNITKSNKAILDLIPGYQKTYILQEC